MPRSCFGLIAGGFLFAISAALAHDPAERSFYIEEGQASWYGPGFHGKATANGEIFDQDQLTAAHPDLPLGVEVRVTNLENGRSVEVQIKDRGPYVRGRVIDLSKAAAERLGMVEAGIAPVRIEASRAGSLRAAAKHAAAVGG